MVDSNFSNVFTEVKIPFRNDLTMNPKVVQLCLRKRQRATTLRQLELKRRKLSFQTGFYSEVKEKSSKDAQHSENKTTSPNIPQNENESHKIETFQATPSLEQFIEKKEQSLSQLIYT